MFENIRLAFQGIWSHKMRSFLTMLGIIIGIASIIAIVSTIKGTSEQIKEDLIGSGNNTVQVMLYEHHGNPVSPKQPTECRVGQGNQNQYHPTGNTGFVHHLIVMSR